jgi:RHS repeat-associated protein
MLVQPDRMRVVRFTHGDVVITRNMDYDSWGNVTLVEQQIEDAGNIKTHTARYAYDGNNHIKQIVYPSGRIVDYARHANGDIKSVKATFNGVTSTVVTNASYNSAPYASPSTLRFGNGLQAIVIRDPSYSPTDILLYAPSTSEIYDYKYYDLDDFGNVVGITDALTDASVAYDYDRIDRLTRDSAVSGVAQTYNYDPNGNRLRLDSSVQNIADQLSTYVGGSNRLATSSVDGAQPYSAQYDGMGNLQNPAAGINAGYDDAGRLSTLWEPSTATGLLTLYNGLGELARVRNWTQDPETHSQELLAIEYFSFAPDGRVLHHAMENLASVQTDYIWLDGQPVAQFQDSYDPSGVLQGTTITYLHTDHLGTPRLGINQDKQVTWRWTSDAFGNGAPSGTDTVRLRFPGQIAFGMGGINYNYFRDYDPSMGRYIESDPFLQPNRFLSDKWAFYVPYMIDAPAKMQPYLYVRGNPLRLIDPLGLQDEAPSGPEDTTGAGNKAQEACDAESDRVDAEKKAADAFARGEYDEHDAAMRQANRAMRRYYRALGTPLNPADYGAE